MSHFIFMLTRQDKTVVNAREVYQSIRRCGLKHVGFKDIGLPLNELKLLANDMRQDGCKVMLEVVSSTRDSELRSIEAAIELKVDYLLGGRHAAEAVKLLKGRDIQYFPFAGHTVGHPTKLTGTMHEIVEDAKQLLDVVTPLMRDCGHDHQRPVVIPERLKRDVVVGVHVPVQEDRLIGAAVRVLSAP